MENLDKNMILEKITNEINRFMTKTRGKTRKVAEICAKHPEIFLEIQKPDTVLKYYLDRENNISAITMAAPVRSLDEELGLNLDAHVEG